jgi:hypothetical protein
LQLHVSASCRLELSAQTQVEGAATSGVCRFGRMKNATSGGTVTTRILFVSKFKLVSYFNPWGGRVIEAIFPGYQLQYASGAWLCNLLFH